MQPEEALFLLDTLLPAYEDELKTTRRVIEAIPEARCDYTPERRIRSAFEMAWHLVSSEVWFLEGVLHGQFAPEEARMPAQIKSIRDIVNYYDDTAPGLIGKLRDMSGEELARQADFFGVANQPVVTYLQSLMAHTVHHRGQLALYLRLMGEKVPSIYGGSLDEPFKMPAA